MYKRARNFILFIAILVLIAVFIAARLNFEATGADAARQLENIGIPSQ